MNGVAVRDTGQRLRYVDFVYTDDVQDDDEVKFENEDEVQVEVEDQDEVDNRENEEEGGTKARLESQSQISVIKEQGTSA